MPLAIMSLVVLSLFFKCFFDGFIYVGLWLVCFGWVCFRYFETFELLCCKKFCDFSLMFCVVFSERVATRCFPGPSCVFWRCFQIRGTEICIRKYAYVQVRCPACFISYIKLVLKLKEHMQLKLAVWVLSKYFPNMKTFAMLIVRTYVNHVRNICHLELANPMTKRTLLVIG